MKIVVMVNGAPSGPFDLETLQQLIQRGEVLPSALGWHDGQEGWLELKQMTLLNSFFHPTPQPQPLQWFYLVRNSQSGPLSTDELRLAITTGELGKNVLVCREGFPSWKSIADCPELLENESVTPLRLGGEPAKSLLESSPAPPPLSNLPGQCDGPVERRPQSSEPASLSNSPVQSPLTNSGLSYAGLDRRFAAGVVDLLVLLLPLLLLNAVVNLGATSETVLIFITWWIYYAVQHCSSHQASLGMRVLKIKITDLDGRTISFARASGRYFLSLLFAIPCYAGFLVIPFTSKKQGLHDLVAKTVVVKDFRPRTDSGKFWSKRRIVWVATLLCGTLVMLVFAGIIAGQRSGGRPTPLVSTSSGTTESSAQPKPEDLAQWLRATTVRIDGAFQSEGWVFNDKQAWFGTGIIIAKEGNKYAILSNCHVLGFWEMYEAKKLAGC